MYILQVNLAIAVCINMHSGVSPAILIILLLFYNHVQSMILTGWNLRINQNTNSLVMFYFILINNKAKYIKLINNMPK